MPGGDVLTAAVLVPGAPPAHAAVTFEERALQRSTEHGRRPVRPRCRFPRPLAAPAGDAPYLGCGYPVAGRATDMGVRNYFSHTILSCNNYGASNMLQAAG